VTVLIFMPHLPAWLGSDESTTAHRWLRVR